MFLFLVHPITIVSIVLALFQFKRLGCRPQISSMLVVTLVCAVLKPLMWWTLLPSVWGWQLSEMGGYLFLHYILPLNGAVTGALIDWANPVAKFPFKFVLSIGVCVLLFAVEFCVYPGFGFVAGNLGNSR